MPRLQEYKRKRDFQRTPEPRGGPKRRSRSGAAYAIQKHEARRLHYDLRLELGGVLKSWAIPKGPSLDPAEKRLAVEVEDHPLEYVAFEGIIPEGEYGGGTVMLWDRGTWEPASDQPEVDLRAGKLSFTLHGEKLKGRWSLVRLRKSDRERKQWLLIKADDEHAGSVASLDGPRMHRSVKSGRTMAEIESNPRSTWTSSNGRKGGARGSKSTRSGGAKRGTRRKLGTSRAAQGKVNPSSLSGARRAAMRQFSAELATLVKDAPVGDQWLHEIKLDGYRILPHIHDGKVRLLTRNGKDWTDRFPEIASRLADLDVKDAVLDSEIVVLDEHGLSRFQLLQNHLNRREGNPPVLNVFDVMHCNGHDLTASPLIERKKLLQQMLEAAGMTEDDPTVRYLDHIVGHGDRVFEHACRMSLEGIMCKRIDSEYESTRTRQWVKVKCVKRQEFVVVGYTDPGGARSHFGSLLLAYNEDGKLKYCGRVGAGFTEQSLKDVFASLRKIKRDEPPVHDGMAAAERAGSGGGGGVHWVQPRLIAEVRFSEWTDDDRLRHPVFQGLRRDKSVAEIVREKPAESKTKRPRAKSRTTRRATAVHGTKAMSKSMDTSRTKSNAKSSSSVTAAARRSPTVVAGVQLSNPDRVMYAGQGITKLQLAEYYERIADRMLPHVAGRPLAVVRCPKGAEGGCFFQKHINERLPDAIVSIPVPEKGGKRETYIGVRDAAGLVSLAQIGVLEVHPWGAREDRLDRPDRLFFDLDPGPGVKWQDVVHAAKEIRERLAALDLRSFVKLTGGKGLHVVAPLQRTAGWDAVKGFAQAIARQMARDEPKRYVAIMTKSRRAGRIFVDYLRNGRGATAIAPYSTRAKPGATVAVPLHWDELDSINRADAFSLDNIDDRLKRLRKDPWRGFDDVRQAITKGLLAEVNISA